MRETCCCGASITAEERWGAVVLADFRKAHGRCRKLRVNGGLTDVEAEALLATLLLSDEPAHVRAVEKLEALAGGAK